MKVPGLYAYLTLLFIGWILMITGFALTLYSRVNLILTHRLAMKLLLAMIIADGIINHVPSVILGYMFWNDDAEKANKARYLMAFAHYEAQHFYEADVLAEHLARAYPKWEMAPKAAEIGMAALTNAYNTYGQIDRSADLDNLVNLANYTAATWPGWAFPQLNAPPRRQVDAPPTASIEFQKSVVVA